ncbi:hypothetical protein MMC13_006649 [Lambiella insularis]|nr:hypothetical protein [Lambiella insularis]
MHLKVWAAILLPFAFRVHSRTYNEHGLQAQHGLQARHDHDADLYARDIDDNLYTRDIDPDLLFERELYDDDFHYARDLQHTNEARDLETQLHERDDHPHRVHKRTVQESPCGYYASGTRRYCTGKVKADPAKTMTALCNKCGKRHKFDTRHYSWFPLGRVDG